MEEIRRAAVASYEHLPAKDKKLARKNFNSMDKNRDGQISLREYVKYVKKKKATDFTDQSIFRALDKDDNGSLDFEEAIVLCYVMQSGRAIICKSCKTFMPGAYFSCSQCFFNASVSTFDICCDCYGGKKFTHHDGATFCDNYTLLRQSRSAIQAAPMTMRRKVLKAIEKGLVLALIAKGLVEIYGKVIEVIFGDDGCDDGGGGCGGDGSGGSGAGGCDGGGGDGGGGGGGGDGGGGGCDDGDGDGDCSIM